MRLDGGDGVVTLTNTTASPALKGLGDDLLDVLRTEEPPAVEPWSADGDPALLELVGTWHWGASTTTAKVVGEHLVLGEPGQGRGSRFAPVGPDAWVGLDGYHTVSRCGSCAARTAPSRTSTSRRFRFSRTPYAPDSDVPAASTTSAGTDPRPRRAPTPPPTPPVPRVSGDPIRPRSTRVPYPAKRTLPG